MARLRYGLHCPCRTCPQDIIWLFGVATKSQDAKGHDLALATRLALPVYGTFWQGLIWWPSGVATKSQDAKGMASATGSFGYRYPRQQRRSATMADFDLRIILS